MIAQSAFADGGLRSHRAGPAGALGCYFGHVPDAAARFDAVLFDLDGVLVDSEPRWNDVRIAYAGARGLAWTHDDQRACMGGNSRQWAEIMRERLGLADEPVERIEADVIEGLVDAYRHGGVEVIAGAPEAVSRIAARWQVAIASSSPGWALVHLAIAFSGSNLHPARSVKAIAASNILSMREVCPCAGPRQGGI